VDRVRLVLSVEPELFETKVVRLAAQPLGVVLFFASSPSWTQAMSHGAVLALITLSMVCIHVKTRSDEFHTQDREPKPQPWWTATAPLGPVWLRRRGVGAWSCRPGPVLHDAHVVRHGLRPVPNPRDLD